MSKMEILNKEYLNNMNQYNDKNKLSLTNYDCECYSNMLFVLNESVNNKFTFEQIIEMYSFFTDVLDGKRPNIALFSHKDAFKGFYNLSKRYSLTKNLKEEERLHFCFVIYWASCIMTIDEETKEPTSNMKCFEKGYKNIIEEYEFEVEQFPNKFKIINYSDPFKKDYGYTVENPIELTSISLQYEYLNGIETDEGKKIIYERVGSFQGKNNIFVDGFDIYIKGLFKNKKITTLYLTGEGSYNSLSVPTGFKFIMN